MGGCSAYNCSNDSRKKFRMFRFPSDPTRRKIWLMNCRRSRCEPGPRAQLCIAHFSESQFESKRGTSWKILKQDAIPTLFDFSDSMSTKQSANLSEPEIVLHFNVSEPVQELKKRDEATKKVIKELNATCSRNAIFEKQCKDLEGEVSQLNAAVCESQKTVQKLCEHETVNKKLTKEIESLKELLASSKEIYEKKISDLKDEIVALQKNHDEKILAIKNEAGNEKEKELAVLINNLQEKDKKIYGLEESLKNINAEKTEEQQKLKLECDEKVERLKQMLFRTRSVGKTTPSKSDEIFRKKYQKLQEEHKAEVESLQKEIESFRSQTSNLQNDKNSAVDSLFFDMDFVKEDVRGKARFQEKENAQVLQSSEISTNPIESSKTSSESVESVFNQQENAKGRRQINKSLTLDRSKNVRKPLQDVGMVDKTDLPKVTMPVKRKKLFNSELNYSFSLS